MIHRVGVWERLSGDHRLVGEMICEIAENGRTRTAFRYEHVLFFDHGAYYPGRSSLEYLGKRWGIRNADGIVAQVFDAVVGWKEEFKSLGVLDKDILRFRGIDSHLQK